MRRVAITGVGVVSSIGIGKDDFLKALQQGKCGVDNVTSFDVSSVKSKIAYLVKDFKLAKTLLNQLEPLEKQERSFLFGLCAALEAISDANINLNDVKSDRVSVCMAASLTGSQFLDMYLTQIHRGEKPDPNLLMYGVANIHSFLSRFLGVSGVGFTVSTACASGTNAIGIGWDLIQKGIADIAVVGGTDCYTRLVHGGFNALQALDEESCRPFSTKRQGTVLAEGSGVIILENLERARINNKQIYVEVLGYSICNDAYHVTAPDPNGERICYVMERTIENSMINKNDVNYINTHGTGTLTNDGIELKGIKKCFGKDLHRISINSNKSQFGHTLAAAGAIEAVATVLQMNHDFISPIVNVKKEDLIADDIEIVVEHSTKKKIDIALSNSFGFGGNNACVALGKYHD